MFACQRERAFAKFFLDSNHIEHAAENTLLDTISVSLYDFMYFARKLCLTMTPLCPNPHPDTQPHSIC